MCAFSFLIRASGFFAKNRIPLLKEPLRQLRDVLWVLNQVANLDSTHIDSNVRPNENKISYGYRHRSRTEI
jgi:hypothetical protein